MNVPWSKGSKLSTQPKDGTPLEEMSLAELLYEVLVADVSPAIAAVPHDATARGPAPVLKLRFSAM